MAGASLSDSRFVLRDFCQAMHLLHPSSFFLHPSSFILHPSSFILLPSSFILHPSSFILLPSSFILLPSSFILLPSSFILLPSSFILLPSLKNPTLTTYLNLSVSGTKSTNYQQKFRTFCQKLVLSKLEFLDLIVGGWKSAANSGR